MAKTRVALIFGGVSSEHEISCISAAAIAEQLDADEYEIYKIGITKKGRWLLFPGAAERIADGSWEQSPDCVPATLSPDRTTRGIITNHQGVYDVVKIDVVFPVLHGRNGEDGTIQGLLELSGIPYVGCDVLSSAACMDKSIANQIFDSNGLAQAKWLSFRRRELPDFDDIAKEVVAKMEFPIFVKPAVGGSSVGITKVKNADELQAAMQLACTHDDTIVFEEGVVGQEVECAVLGNKQLTVSLPGEIVSCNEIYDYEAKYQSGDASQQYLPARLSEEKLNEVRDMAKKTYEAMGCTGLARIDFFVEEDTERVLINEVNTMPGFTTISMYPKLMEMTGIPFSQLCDRLIALALERGEV